MNESMSDNFINSCKGLEQWTAMEWLSHLDDDELDKLKDISDLFFKSRDDDDIPLECVDYLMLCYLVAEVETGKPSDQLTSEEKEDSVVALNLFTNFESLRRKGLLEVSGSGRITEFSQNNTVVKNTDAGNVVSSALKTMLELSDGVEQ